ncbi:lysosomal Pro-X carboxypeptidase-like [Salvia splendens]|uniref:lysosomal Pro-X carboxypeptidase-like n=1 Tax=Salvia splendens TaxID=180675 RepID=UPI001C26C9A9|nr:lysosomal Pro-X carboxypeptidase-like [Salvia splendens]
MNSFQSSLILLLILPFFLHVISIPSYIPRLSLPHQVSVISSIDGFDLYYYTQSLDHFNFAPSSYNTFNQKYFVNTKYWGGPNSSRPIFAYLGAEQPLDASGINSIGIINDNAPRFKALSIFIEHRYYGESIPFGTMEEALRNETTRGYFNSAQALADYAEILLHVKKEFLAHDSPIVVFGGSYGGMLATWFRLKYPHIAIGALASSAPVLYLDDVVEDGYFSVVTKDFKEASLSCYESIKTSWDDMDYIASLTGGLSILSQRFNTCMPLTSVDELKQILVHMYAHAAQYNYPQQQVRRICQAIDGFPIGTDSIGRISAGYLAIHGDVACFNKEMVNCQSDDHPSEVAMGWSWQTCSEMVMPIGIGERDTMFQASPFNLEKFIQNCERSYGIPPRPHWITTYYGAHKMKSVLKQFGSNIIFSNGLQDPYSSGGVLQDINESIVAVTSDNGSHCVDLAPASKNDPEWLIIQRETEIEHIQGWLATYYKGGTLLHAPSTGRSIIIIVIVIVIFI